MAAKSTVKCAKPSKASVVTRAKSAYAGGKGQKQPRWDLVEQYLPLVKSIAGRMRIYFPSHIDMEDIYSVGVSGLISATQNYDPVKNPSFGSYARIRVRGSMLDELRRLDWMPRLERTQLKKYRKAVEALEQELKRPPSDKEICERVGISEKELSRIKNQQTSISFVPLHGTSANQADQESRLDEVIADANQPDARDFTEKRELIDLLRVRLDKLPEMPKKVIAMYYLKGMRLAEIALAVGLTESRICQIHAQAISELRNLLKRQLSG